MFDAKKQGEVEEVKEVGDRNGTILNCSIQNCQIFWRKT